MLVTKNRESSTADSINMVFENSDFIIINKPAGISFHNHSTEVGLFNKTKAALNRPLWPVHRLDKLTSGLLIFAKSQSTAAKLGHLFEQKLIHKTYIAISDKKPKKKQGHITGDMKKTRSGSWKLCHSKNNPAQTFFKSYSLVSGLRLFWIIPSTGKTHQIRVALKSISSAILGDLRYKGTQADRGYLHAYRLFFNWNNQLIDINCLPTSGDLFIQENVEALIQKIQTEN